MIAKASWRVIQSKAAALNAMARLEDEQCPSVVVRVDSNEKGSHGSTFGLAAPVPQRPEPVIEQSDRVT